MIDIHNSSEDIKPDLIGRYKQFSNTLTFKILGTVMFLWITFWGLWGLKSVIFDNLSQMPNLFNNINGAFYIITNTIFFLFWTLLGIIPLYIILSNSRVPIIRLMPVLRRFFTISAYGLGIILFLEFIFSIIISSNVKVSNLIFVFVILYVLIRNKKNKGISERNTNTEKKNGL